MASYTTYLFLPGHLIMLSHYFEYLLSGNDAAAVTTATLPSASLPETPQAGSWYGWMHLLWWLWTQRWNSHNMNGLFKFCRHGDISRIRKDLNLDWKFSYGLTIMCLSLCHYVKIVKHFYNSLYEHWIQWNFKVIFVCESHIFKELNSWLFDTMV